MRFYAIAKLLTYKALAKFLLCRKVLERRQLRSLWQAFANISAKADNSRRPKALKHIKQFLPIPLKRYWKNIISLLPSIFIFMPLGRSNLAVNTLALQNYCFFMVKLRVQKSCYYNDMQFFKQNDVFIQPVPGGRRAVLAR